MLELNFKVITDEIMALTALRKVSAANRNAGMLVTRDQLPGLRVLARMVFAETVLMLGNVVAWSEIDETDVQAEHPYDAAEAPKMRLKLSNTGGLESGQLMVLRRHLEHAVAAGILSRVATSADAEFSALLEAQRAAAIEAVADAVGFNALFKALRLPGWP